RLAATHDPEIQTRINAYEMAYRMQSSAPELMDLSRESAATFAAYGAEAGKPSFATNCLLARRLVESGVRVVQVYTGNLQPWDTHDKNAEGHQKLAHIVDQPIAALLGDLEQRGLLHDTLVVWGGEFGRTPTTEGGSGRDHNHYGFSMWLAGGGVKGGLAYGATDEFGFRAVEKRVHVHDLHATLLHLMGLDHEKLTYRYSGRDFRLTDVHGTVVKDIIA
ncbi:MAG: DUF1501 domain-containing protein, partial [Gemmata sp.]